MFYVIKIMTYNSISKYDYIKLLISKQIHETEKKKRNTKIFWRHIKTN